MYLLSFFTLHGLPVGGLTPTLRVRTVADGAIVVADEVMAEVGDGWYRYAFAAYDPATDYVIRCDGGPLLPIGERYTFAGSDNSAAVWASTLRTLTAFGFTVVTDNAGDVSAIKARTDLLPDHPAAVGSAMTLTAAYDAAKSAAPTVNEIWQRVVEAGLTAEELLRLISAVLAGKVHGAGTPTITFRDVGDVTDRVVSNVDAYGNRLTVATDVS